MKMSYMFPACSGGAGKLQGASAKRQVIRLNRIPMFFRNPQNGKERIGFCDFGSCKVVRSGKIL